MKINTLEEVYELIDFLRENETDEDFKKLVSHMFKITSDDRSIEEKEK